MYENAVKFFSVWIFLKVHLKLSSVLKRTVIQTSSFSELFLAELVGNFFGGGGVQVARMI